jgi:hypothetical protein
VFAALEASVRSTGCSWSACDSEPRCAVSVTYKLSTRNTCHSHLV